MTVTATINPACADDTTPEPGYHLVAAAHFGKVYQTAKSRYETDPANQTNAWGFAKACFDWADYVPDKSQRAQIATEGITAARQVIERDADSAPGHYYLALNLGQLARTKTLGALKLVSQMETEFKEALRLDPKFDYAGPDRTLGMLYNDAPGWPLSIGGKLKSRPHLLAAVKAFPLYPENYLALIEIEINWGEYSDAARDLATLDAEWAAAKQQFPVAQWPTDWPDWTARRESLRSKIMESGRPLKSPRNSPSRAR